MELVYMFIIGAIVGLLIMGGAAYRAQAERDTAERSLQACKEAAATIAAAADRTVEEMDKKFAALTDALAAAKERAKKAEAILHLLEREIAEDEKSRQEIKDAE